MNSQELHRIRDIASFTAEADHLSRDQTPIQAWQEGYGYVLAEGHKPVRAIWLCVRLLAKILMLGLLIFDKLDSIEGLLCKVAFPKEERKETP